jgi:hypothetical protein
MRTLRDLDEEIERAERRLATRREHLNESLQSSRTRTRRSLASPPVLAAALVAGFLIERLGRAGASRRGAPQGKAAGMAGIAAGLAAAALRAALSNPRLWTSVRNAWARRAEAKMPYGLSAGAHDYTDPLQRHPGKPDVEAGFDSRDSVPAGSMPQDLGGARSAGSSGASRAAAAPF